MQNIDNEECFESLREIVNIGMGSGASVLNMMLNSHISLKIPIMKFVSRDELIYELSDSKEDKLAAVNMSYSGEVSGDIQLIFTQDSAVQLVAALVGPEAAEDMVEDIGAGALVEMGNVVLNGVMGSVSNVLGFTFTYSVPNYLEDIAEALVKSDVDNNDTTMLMAKTNFEIQEFNIMGNLILYFKYDSVKRLLLAIRNMIEELSRDD